MFFLKADTMTKIQMKIDYWSALGNTSSTIGKVDRKDRVLMEDMIASQWEATVGLPCLMGKLKNSGEHTPQNSLSQSMRHLFLFFINVY